MDHEEYKKLLKTNPDSGIVKRLEKIAEAIAEYDYDANLPKEEVVDLNNTGLESTI